MPTFNRYKGSPDVFDETGKYYNQGALSAAGVSDPATVSELGTTRPDIKNESDFARLAGTNIGGIDTSQPNPATVSAGLQKVQTQGVGPDGKPIYDVFAGQEHIQDPNDPRLKGVDISGLQTGQAPAGFKSKFEQGFQNASDAGISSLDSAGQAMSAVQKYAPSQKRDLASTFLQSDPYIEGLVSSFQQYIDPKNQRASLSDTYNQMMKDSGIEALDMELINTKNVIEGSEDDLRNEITKAGGFATESQVMALTNARNKQIIKNYNTLLDTRNSKEKYLETMIGLESQDRQAADQRFESMFNMGLQIADYQQKMKQNAQQQFQWLQQTTGFDGLYDATGGDPYYTNLVEQSLGLPPGGLLTSANQARLEKMQAAETAELERADQLLGLELKQQQIKTPEQLRMESEGQALDLQGQKLGLQLKGEQIKTEQAQRSKIINDIASTNSKGFTVDPQTGQNVVVPVANNSLTDLLLQYRTEVENSSKVSRFFKPSTNSKLESLRSQITAVYKQEQKLGALDAGVQKLIENIVGSSPGSKLDPRSWIGLALPSKQSENAILSAVDSFLTNQSGIDLSAKKELEKSMPKGEIMVINRTTREIGSIPPGEFNSNLYIKI